MRRSRNRLPAASPTPWRTAQSRSPAPVTSVTSPSPLSPSVSTSTRPCTTRSASFISLVTASAPTRTACSARAVKNKGASASTPEASTTMRPPPSAPSAVETRAVSAVAAVAMDAHAHAAKPKI